MGNFSTFYLLNFSSILENHLNFNDDIESFNYLFDKELIKERTPQKSVTNSIINISNVVYNKESENLEYFEFGKN